MIEQTVAIAGEVGSVESIGETRADAHDDGADLPARLRRSYVAHVVAGVAPARRHAFAQRALDLALGLPLAALLLPLLGALALAIWLGLGRSALDAAESGAPEDGRRPPIFALIRYAGRGGVAFVGSELAALRATRLRWLARLPLIINVVRGEMSLVGPRPLPYAELAQPPDPTALAARIALARLYVKPGFVGPWLSQPARGALAVDGGVIADPDLLYVARGSFARDLAILALAPLALLRRRL